MSASGQGSAEHGRRVSPLFEARERRHEEAFLRGQTELLELIATGAPLDEVLTRLTQIVEAQAPGMMCSVLLLTEDGRHLQHGAAPSLPEEYNRIADGHEIGPAEGSCGTAAYRQEQVIVSDIQRDPLWEAYRGIAEQFGLRACWSTPVFSQRGTLLGTLAMYYGEPRTPRPEELRLIGVATNIAAIAIERKRVEHELHASDERFALLAELRASEERFAITFQSTPISLVITSLDDNRLVAVNNHFLEMTGYSREEVVGRGVIELGIWVDEAARERALTTLHAAGSVENLEVECRTKSGELRPQLLSMRKITLGGRECLLTAGTDITERKRTADERAALEAELRQAQKMEALGRLAGGIAHDFNNLLTVIKGYTALLREHLPEEAKHDADQIRRASERAAALTRQLLTVARRQVVQPERVDLNEVVRGMDRLLRPLIGTTIELVTVLEPDLPPVEADLSQIEQVISNLALNARDAMPGGGKLLIETSTASSVPAGDELAGDWVRLRVQDTGAGIDPETLEHLFEPFYTTKTLGEGMGLGLATVHGIVEQTGGTVAVESKLGQGTSIEILLPAQKGSSARPAPEAEHRPLASLDGTEAILVVEDEEIVRALTLRVLQEHGYRVIEARYASEALELWQIHRDEIDLVLSDIVMPGMSGAQLARHLAEERPEVPIILMSGFADAALTEPEQGRGSFLEKPFAPDALLHAVRELLDGT